MIYTLTQFPTVARVRFEVNGQNVATIGEVSVRGPQTPAMYGSSLPAITVQNPVIGERVTSPVTVSGTADVFEGTVSIRVLNSAGHEIARTFTTATCGMGCVHGGLTRRYARRHLSVIISRPGCPVTTSFASSGFAASTSRPPNPDYSPKPR